MSRRILLVSPYDVDTFGGVQVQVDGIARALSNSGEEVGLIAPGTGAERERHGYRFFPATGSISVPINGSRAPVAPTPSARRAVRRAIARFDPTVIHLHEPLAPGPPLFALRAFAGPVVATFHRARPGWIYPLFGRLLTGSVRRIDIQVAVSTAAAQTARASVGSAYRGGHVVPNGIDACVISATVATDPVIPTVLFAGRHEHRKGLEVLLDAFSGIEGPIELWVVGAGPETSKLRRRYPDERITWLGPVDDEEKFRRFRSADLFVAPSLGGESFGVVLLEALAAGTAVVASDLPGYREAAGSFASYVLPGNPLMLRAAIAESFSDLDQTRRRGQLGRRRANKFDFTVIASQYRSLYDAAIAADRPVRTDRGALRRLRP